MKRKKQQNPAETHVSDKTRAEVLTDIQRLEQAGDANKLGGYFIQLAKWGNQPQQYENLFRRYLTAADSYLREAAIFCLLFALQIQKPAYRAAGLAMFTDEAEDFDVRMWAGSGLAVAYKNTKDPELLAAFLTFVDDEATDKHLKVSFIRDIILLMGASSREQWLRAQSDSVAALQAEFAVELVAARRLAQAR